MSQVQVITVGTAAEREAAFEVRRRVFHIEQNISIEEEFDEYDASALHALAMADGQPAGTGRLVLLPGAGKIGRMAVLGEYRRLGVGRALLEHLIAAGLEAGQHFFVLHAQVQAIPFYESAGFQALGDVFDEAGIPHRKMVCAR